MFNFLFANKVAAAGSSLVDLALVIEIGFQDLSQDLLIKNLAIKAKTEASTQSKTRGASEIEDEIFSENRDLYI